MKRLFLLRHAKTVQANKDTPDDAERPLTESGRRDAAEAGRTMRERGYEPDLILCSPSVRTRQTLELANAELRSSARIDYVDAIYNASARRLLAVVQNIDDAVQRPLLVGHNPGFEELAAMLTIPAGASAFAASADADRLPTAALAAFDFELVRWKDLGPHSGALFDFAKPKDRPAP